MSMTSTNPPGKNSSKWSQIKRTHGLNVFIVTFSKNENDRKFKYFSNRELMSNMNTEKVNTIQISYQNDTNITPISYQHPTGIEKNLIY